MKSPVPCCGRTAQRSPACMRPGEPRSGCAPTLTSAACRWPTACSPAGARDGTPRSANQWRKAAELAATDWSPSDERRDLGEAQRRLLDVVVRTGAGPAELKAAAATVD